MSAFSTILPEFPKSALDNGQCKEPRCCPAASESRLRWAQLLVVTLLAIYVIQCFWFIRTQSFTWDEPIDIYVGWKIWRHGDFHYWKGHPPLSRLLCTLPIMGARWQMKVPSGWDFPALGFYPSPQEIATRGRAMNVLLGVILALVLWGTARDIFSTGAATLAVALFAFSPALIANYSLISTDGAGTLFTFATSAQLLRWRQRRSRLNTLLLGMVMGLLLISKVYTLPIFFLGLGWILVLRPKGVVFDLRKWNWKSAVVVCVIAFLILWAAYRFHVSYWRPNPNSHHVLIWELSRHLHMNVPIPAPEYIAAVRGQAAHNQQGHESFFLGRASREGGWKLYYPIVILLKWPAVVLVLLFMLVGLQLRHKFHLPPGLLVMASFPAIFFSMALFSRIDIGERLILPLYPFALLLAGTWWHVARRSRVALALMVVAVGLQAVDCLRYAPDYLSYFTPFVSSNRTYTLLSDSNLDWGQGLLALRQYELKHPGEKMYLAYYGNVMPSVYGIHALELREDQRVSDATVVVSASNLTGQTLNDPASYRWIQQYPEITVLNHTLHVFKVPRLRSAPPLTDAAGRVLAEQGHSSEMAPQ